MRHKLVWCFVVGMLICGFVPIHLLRAQGATIAFRTGLWDKEWNTIFGPDGKPLPDSSYMMLILAGENGVADPPNCDGSPGGDDIQPTGNFFNHLYIHDPGTEHPDSPPGNILVPERILNAKPDGELEEPAVNTGDKIYFRAFNHKDPSQATHYNDMIATDDRPNTVYEIPIIDGVAIYNVIMTFGPAKPLCPEKEKKTEK